MASPANNNSSSSPPIPNRPNPKPRNSEVGDPFRRSFGGNPFPVNSKVNIPSDVSRRNSFGGRGNSRVDFSDKENETKALPTPKGSKNFMSPTISAVSKINPSPRKRVLSDKNEMSRSLSDVKGLTLEDTKSHLNARSCLSFSDVIGIDEKKRFERPHDMTVTDFDENEVHEDKGIVYSDPRFRISPRPSVPYTSPEFADHEVEALAPPYDPKKNYLSPRPQFLHYKPNPRVECKQLEVLFISESSSSDTELSAEESERCEEQEKDASHEGGAQAVVEEETAKESEKCDEQAHEGGTKLVVEEETGDVEQLESESDEEMVCESSEETTQVPKQSGFRKFKFLGWLLVLSLGFLLVTATFSGPTGLSTLKESPLYEFHIPKGIKEFAKANNWEQLSEKLWKVTESSLVYIDKLISHLRAEEEHGPLQFHNLTFTLENDCVFEPTRVEINEEPLQEMSRGENNPEDGYDNELEEDREENSEVVSETKDGDEESNEVDEQTEMTPGTDNMLNEGEGNLEALVVEWHSEEQRDSEVILPEVNNDARGLESEEKLETGPTKKEHEEEEAESEAIYINQHDVETAAIKLHQQEEVVLADAESGSEVGFSGIAADTSDDLHPQLQKSEVADGESESEDGFSGVAAETSDGLHPKLQQSEVADSESESEDGFGENAAETSDDLHPKVRSFNNAMIVSSSAVLVLLAAAAFLFTKKAKPVAASTPKPSPETEEVDFAHVPVENLMKEKLSSLNLQAGEEEEVDDRISNSFHKKSSSVSNNKVPKEHRSLGGKSKSRRESLASSASEYSVGSFSYGSFTTYEKIPIKSGDREEEMITPVRRSSRIRNHHNPSMV